MVYKCEGCKKSVHSIRLSDEQKNQVTKNYLNQLNQQVIKNLKNKKIMIFVVEDKS